MLSPSMLVGAGGVFRELGDSDEVDGVYDAGC